MKEAVTACRRLAAPVRSVWAVIVVALVAIIAGFVALYETVAADREDRAAVGGTTCAVASAAARCGKKDYQGP